MDRLKESIKALQDFLDQQGDTIDRISKMLVRSLKAGGRVYALGNGGSAADAQHFAAELVGRFRMDRKGIPAMALTTNASILTSLSNDYGFQSVFVRQVEALVREGDIVVAISTSGNSPNVLGAVALAREMGALTIGMTGRTGGKLKDACDVCLRVPSDDTPHIQECHIATIHVLCGLIEEALFGKPAKRHEQ